MGDRGGVASTARCLAAASKTYMNIQVEGYKKYSLYRNVFIVDHVGEGIKIVFGNKLVYVRSKEEFQNDFY